MASKVGSKVLLLIFLVFFATFYTNQAAQTSHSNQLLLRKLGWKLSDLEHYKERSHGANIQLRAAPAGPDDIHHFANAPLPL